MKLGSLCGRKTFKISPKGQINKFQLKEKHQFSTINTKFGTTSNVYNFGLLEKPHTSIVHTNYNYKLYQANFATKTKKADAEEGETKEKRKRFWDVRENQILFLEQVKKQLKFQKYTDWFTLSSADVSMRGGAGLLQRYNGNLYTALASLYPEHNWNILEVDEIPYEFWEARDNHKYYLDLLGKKMNLNTQSDWEKLTIQDILNNRGADLLKVYNGKLITVLKSVYPEKQWNSTPNLEENYWDNPEHVKEFVYQLKRNCKFETEQDWYTVTREQIEENRGVGLYDKGGLYAALKLTYPEIEWNAKIFRKKDAERISILKGLFSQTIHHAKPIPTTPPFKFKVSRNSKTDVQLMLARNWDSSIDPTGYWISEKFDGIRGFWDGKTLFSRHGNILNAPDWWKAKLPPDMRLDGEVWTDYGEFSKLNGMVKFDKEWKNVKLMVFDSPNNLVVFEERIEKLKNANIENDVVRLVPYVKCTGYDHLQRELERVNALGGEGLMIRKDDSLYIEGRSSDMLKVKQLLDCEVRMLKPSEKAVAFDCELPNGAEIIARCAYHEYQNPPKAGTVLTIAHYGFWKSGKLKHPFVLRKRDDITWEQAVEAFKEQHPDQMVVPIRELEREEEEEEEEEEN